MRLFHVTAIVPACVFSSGCGGGSGKNSTSSSPTLNNLKTNTTFDRSVAILRFDEDALAGSAFSIGYVASSKSYTLTRGTTTTTFDDASVRALPTGEVGRNAPASEITYYDKSTATSTNALFLTKTGGANQTRYVGGGLWAHQARCPLPAAATIAVPPQARRRWPVSVTASRGHRISPLTLHRSISPAEWTLRAQRSILLSLPRRYRSRFRLAMAS